MDAADDRQRSQPAHFVRPRTDVRYLPHIFHYGRETSGEADHFDEHRNGGLPIRAFRPRAPSIAKRLCDRTKDVVLRGTESLLTHRWREMDSNFPFRAR